MNYSTYQRRLVYLLELLQKRFPLTPDSLSEKFDCDPKTIRNMVNHLRDDGYDIQWCRRQKTYVLNHEVKPDKIESTNQEVKR